MNQAEKIRALPVEAWVSGSNFATDEDTRDIEPYYRGLQIGRNAEQIFIGVDGSWRANLPDGQVHNGPEKIGLTPNTRWLYQGFLDSRVPIFVQRFQGGRIVRYELVIVSGDGLRAAQEVGRVE